MLIGRIGLMAPFAIQLSGAKIMFRKRTPNPEGPTIPGVAFCDERIAHFKKTADRQKRWWRLFQYTTMIVTVALTVVAGLSVGNVAVINKVPWLIPVMSGIAALCSTLLAASRAQEQYLYHRKIEVRMKAERILYQQGAGAYSKLSDEGRARRLTERIVEIWTSSYEEWENTIRQSQADQPIKRDINAVQSDSSREPSLSSEPL
jgi:hypothetical protein